MLKDTRAIVASEVKKGRTLQQIQQAKLLTRWDEKYGGDYIKPDVWVETLYDDITHPKVTMGYEPHGHAGEKK
jgi:hypothetical protein